MFFRGRSRRSSRTRNRMSFRRGGGCGNRALRVWRRILGYGYSGWISRHGRKSGNRAHCVWRRGLSRSASASAGLTNPFPTRIKLFNTAVVTGLTRLNTTCEVPIIVAVSIALPHSTPTIVERYVAPCWVDLFPKNRAQDAERNKQKWKPSADTALNSLQGRGLTSSIVGVYLLLV